MNELTLCGREFMMGSGLFGGYSEAVVVNERTSHDGDEGQKEGRGRARHEGNKEED